MRIAVGVLACALASCSEARPTDAPSAGANVVETAQSTPRTEVQAQLEALQAWAEQATPVKRLWQLWEDALTKDDKDRSDPNAKALRDAIKLYTQAEQAKDDALIASYRDFTLIAAQLRSRAQ